jgi:putative hydrolase of the HAD superfamily
MARPEALLLDAGKTLVFLDHVAVAQAAADAGVQVRPAALAEAEPQAKRRYEAAMVGGMSHEAGWLLHMRVLFACAGVPEHAVEAATASAQAEHARFNLWRKVPDGLPAHLPRARAAGHALRVISNSEGQLEALFARVGLDTLFTTVVDSARVGVRKPDPGIFELGLGRMGIAAARAVYAGDIPSVDVDGARAVGMGAVLIDALDHYPGYTAAPRFRSVSALLEAWQLT